MTEEEFEAWKVHPTTQVFFKWLNIHTQQLQNDWAAAAFMDDNVYKSAVRNAGALGECSMAAKILGLDYAQIEEDLSDGAS
jgi:hypothetical protein